MRFDPGVYVAELSANPTQSDFHVQLPQGLHPIEISEILFSVERLRD